MVNRLLLTIPASGINSQFISELELSADQLPSAARGLLTSLISERAESVKTRSEASGSAAPMPAAPFVWRADGRPDWGVMWTTFCDLAMYGGPPHRPKNDAVLSRPDAPMLDPTFDATGELQRGIWETTDLMSESSGSGWVAVMCRSKRMAAWLCDAILLENVQARSDGNRLLVPASQGFTLEGEVKSVITVVAKTVHYWEQHFADI